VDRYLTPLTVPMKAYPGKQRNCTLNFHRPLQEYVNVLSECGLLVHCMKEIPSHVLRASGPNAKAKNLAQQEIPLFVGLRAVKVPLASAQG
jgi:hypothetical protein